MAPAKLPAMKLEAGTRVGDYTLLEELARGGQGVVYRARRADGRLVALKLLLDHDPETARRLRLEARTLARLRHPHLVTVLDLDALPDGTPWLAMELVEGEDLQRRVEREGPLAPAEVVRMLGAVADALHTCHGQGVIHRDVKPQNVLIERGSGRPLLIDFGLLKRDGLRLAWSTQDAATLTREGELLGTPAFMPPEQVDPRFGELGPASDVYALGATLYFLLTGEAPFQGPSAWNVISALLQSPAPDPRRKNPAAPPALAELCRRSLSKDPGDRPLSAAAFAEVLRAAGSPARSGQSGRRLAAAGLTCAGLLLGAIGLALGPTRPVLEPAPRDPGWEERLDRAEARLAAGDRSGSLGELERVIEEIAAAPRAHPQLPRACYLRGLVRSMSGDQAGAIADYDRALALAPDSPATLFRRGHARALAGDHAGALADLDRSLALDPRLASAKSLNIRASSLVQLGRLTEAVADFDRALELDPGLAGAWLKRAAVRQVQGDAEGALADYGRAIELAPTPGAHSNRGLLRVGRGLLAAAREDYDRAIELDPGYAPAFLNRGDVYRLQGELERARADVDRAIALDPRSARAHASRGVLREQQGDLAGATADLERFLELAPGDPLAPQIRERLERLRAQGTER